MPNKLYFYLKGLFRSSDRCSTWNTSTTAGLEPQWVPRSPKPKGMTLGQVRPSLKRILRRLTDGSWITFGSFPQLFHQDQMTGLSKPGQLIYHRFNDTGPENLEGFLGFIHDLELVGRHPVHKISTGFQERDSILQDDPKVGDGPGHEAIPGFPGPGIPAQLFRPPRQGLRSPTGGLEALLQGFGFLGHRVHQGCFDGRECGGQDGAGKTTARPQVQPTLGRDNKGL